MYINIGVGADNLVFGMTQKEVVEIIGKPYKVTINETNDGEAAYYKEMFKLKFTHLQHNKLYSIEDYNTNIIFLGGNVREKSKTEIKGLLLDHGYSDTIYDDYDYFDTLFCEKLWTTFSFRFDKLYCLEFSPLRKNTDKWVWPAPSK